MKLSASVLISSLMLLAVPVALRAQAPATHPLDVVMERVKATKKEGKVPVVVFDLDDTLFRTGHRHKAIFTDWVAKAPDERKAYGEKLAAIDPWDFPWSDGELMDRIGIPEDKREEAKTFWGDAFFSSTYLHTDQPIKGGPEYVNSLHAEGAYVAYLTGRDSERMKEGTEKSLEAHGYPRPGTERVQLFLKPEAKQKDTEFKKVAVEEIRKLGVVVASFDNEPKNVNMFREAYPDATMVYLDVVHSPNPPPLTETALTVKDFTR